MVELGADVEVIDHEGKTPVTLACQVTQKHLLKIIMLPNHEFLVYILSDPHLCWFLGL